MTSHLSAYELACEIRKATGWSQERLSEETGLGLSTISRIFRRPGYAGNTTSASLLSRLHEKVVGSPFPADVEKIYSDYGQMREEMPRRQFDKFLHMIEWLLDGHSEMTGNSLAACRLRWLMGNIHFDRAFYLRKADGSAGKALEWYEKALQALEQQDDPALLVQRYKLRQCLVSTRFNSCNESTRSTDENIRHWLRDMEYLELVAAVVKEDNWNWMAARNGLVAASILQDAGRCRFFWKAMQRVSRYFADLNYKPSSDIKAINHDPDCRWFIQNIA